MTRRSRVNRFEQRKRTTARKHREQQELVANPEMENNILSVFDTLHESVLPLTVIQERLKLDKAKNREFGDALNSLIVRGVIKRVKGKRFRRIDRTNPTLSGRISVVADRGFGFVAVGKGDDIFVPPNKLNGARHGDLVEVEFSKTGRYGRRSASVYRIIERSDKPVIGIYRDHFGHGGMVYPDDPRLPGPIKIAVSQAMDASDRDRVEIQIISDRHELRGKITRVFGSQYDPNSRFKSLIAENKFHEVFPDAVLEEVEKLSEELTHAELADRLDLRDRIIFTIDPDDAKDFDDALSLKKIKGGYELGVHIADVSWYVRPGSEVDEEARSRGTSVYTSHGTLPMLPERLSSDLCSLREGVPRRTFSVFLEMDNYGKVKDYTLTRSVILSAKRFTYGQAQAVIDKNQDKLDAGKLPAWRNDRMTTVLVHLAALTRNMRALRLKQGGLELDVPEYEVELDERGSVTGIHKRVVIESNHLVEECMLAANRAVTEFAVRKRGSSPKVFVYRVHDKPDPDAIEEFAMFVQGMGIDWPFGWAMDSLPSAELNKWLLELRDHPLGGIVRRHALRAMAKALYDTENIGHYGLGFANYTHFTSPIRRYPDLVVHRILLDSLNNTAKYGRDQIEFVKRAALSSSERERAAQVMERESLKIRQAEYFRDQVGKEFDGMITSAIPKGVFVEVADTGTEGLINADDLGDVFFDRRITGFVDAYTHNVWSPGLKIRVRVTHADEQTGHIDLVLA